MTAGTTTKRRFGRQVPVAGMATTATTATATTGQGTADNVLEVRDLRVWFDTPRGQVRAVDGVDLELKRGETIGVVGESGSGKSVLSRAVMKILAPNAQLLPGSRILLD